MDSTGLAIGTYEDPVVSKGGEVAYNKIGSKAGLTTIHLGRSMKSL